MEIIIENKCCTLFTDLDGVLTKHHANPDDYTDKPEFLPGALKLLKHLREMEWYIVLTTGRSKEKLQPVLNALKLSINFEFDAILCNLPTGIRFLCNDQKYKDVPKAIAINPMRNKGINIKDFYESIIDIYPKFSDK